MQRPGGTLITIENHSNSLEEKRQAITNVIRSSLIDFNLSHYPETIIKPVILTVSLNCTIAGGLIGRIAWNWLHIELLWLDQSLRGRGYGTSLIQEAEDIA